MKICSLCIGPVQIALVLFILLLGAVGGAAEEKQAEKPTNLAPSTTLALIEIYTLSNALPKDLIDLQNTIDKTADVETILDKLPDIAELVELMDWEATTAKTKPTISYHELTSLDAKLGKLKLRLDLLNLPLNENVDHLEKWYREWVEKESSIEQLRAQLVAQETEIVGLEMTIKAVEEIIATGKNSIEEHIRPALQAGQKIGQIQTKVYELNDTITDLIRELNSFDVQQTSPSILSTAFYQGLSKRLLENGWLNIRVFLSYQITYLIENISYVIVWLMGAALLTLCIHLSRPLVKASSQWYYFASNPVPTGIYLASAILVVINILPTHFNLPPEWDSLLILQMIFSVSQLTETVCKTPWQSNLVRRATILLGIVYLLKVVELPQSFLFFLILNTSLIGFLFYLNLFRRRWQQAKTRKFTWAVFLWGVFPLVIIVAGITGHDRLAMLILEMTLSITVVTLMLCIELLIFSGFVELLLSHFPLQIIRENASGIVKKIFPVLFLLLFFIWLTITLTILRIYPTLEEAITAFSSVNFYLGTLSVTPASILVIVFVCYLTVMFSQGFRAFLQQEVLSRYGVEIGVQASITRLVHYALLTIGFFVLLKMLGFELKQLTILGGALGVGVGFGLQAIVNNFVSGLILLFERPLKVGDVIEAGEDIGVVKELGLRATVVETFDNAEIVIPNSELITGSVINWTLAAKDARVKVPVGVAYGSDIAEVLKILLSCADQNPMVLSNPKPQALFLAFGASSLDFELRAWIPDVSERLTVLSELNQDIEAEFGFAGIEIPFPQSDLHVRTVHENAMAVLATKECPTRNEES